MQFLSRICLLLFSFYLVNVARGQLVSFSVKNESLEKVFLLVEQQSEYKFIYSTELIRESRPVTLTVSEEQLTSVLNKCFFGQPLQYSISGKHILVKENIKVKTSRTLTGKVVDEEGTGVAGITLTIRGMQLQTATDRTGNFTLQAVPSKAVLLISGAEMESFEQPVGHENYVIIPIKIRVGSLDEAIVMAYGRTNKRFTTGTIAKVTKEEIKKQPVGNILSVLPGRISGVQITPLSGAPGTNIIVQIRGRNSIANGNYPLYIVDGVPFPATTLNNSTGGAGTTSSPLDNLNPSDIESIEVLKDADATAIFGSRGANGVILITTKKGKPGKSVFSFRAYTGLGEVTRRLPLLSTQQYLQMRREAYNNDGINPTAIDGPDLLLWDPERYTDWQKVLLGESVNTTDMNASLSGGNEYTQFLISAGYHKETTIIPGDFGSEKINGIMTINHRSPNRRFFLSLTSSYLFNKNILPREDISPRIVLPPNAPAIYKADGSLNWENSTWSNPMSVLRRFFTNETQTFNSNITLSYEVLPNLNVKLTGGYSDMRLQEHGVTPVASFNPSTVSSSSATFGSNNVKTLIAEPQLSYERSWLKHKLETVVGLTIQQTDQEGLQQTGSGYASDELLKSLKSAATVVTNTETGTRYRYTGFFGRVAYNYDKKYLATVTVRRDGSSRFGPANRFSTFGSLGLGWIFTRENWMHQQTILSFGKIKASAGKTGNDQIGDYRYLDLYSPYSFTYQSVVPFYPTQLFNPAYGWEEVYKREIGLDLGFLKDRILVTANYYHNTTSNQLINYPLPTATGYAGILRNLPATIRNNGLELELSAIVIKKKKFSWNVSGNITLPHNKLEKFDDLGNSTYASVYIVGEPLSIAKRLSLTGINPATGIYTYRDFDNNGSINFPQDEQAVVDAGQRFYGGLQQEIIFGKLSFSMLFQFIRQPYAGNYLARFGMPGKMENQPDWVLGRWQKVGENTSIQRFAVTNSQANLAYTYLKFSDASLTDASFIRLRNLYIAYDLLTTKLSKSGVKNLQLFLQGHNLVTITNYKGLDPETQTFLPPVKLLTAGVQVSF